MIRKTSSTLWRQIVVSKVPYLLMIEAVFVLTITIAWKSIYPVVQALTPLQFILLVMATLRLSHTLSFNEVGEPLRAPFTYVEPDSCKAGSDVKPKGTGFQYAIGSLLACPICSGQWSALILLLALAYLNGVGWTLVGLFSVAGGQEVLHYYSTRAEWQGRLARVQSGAIAPDKE